MQNSLIAYKEKLKGLAKKEKLDIINQDIVNIGLSIISTNDRSETGPKRFLSAELEKLREEINDNIESYQSTSLRKELIPFMHDRDLNWYFNAKKIPAQKNLVAPTYEYLTEGEGKGIFEPVDFFNLLEFQKDFILNNLDRPFDTLNKLKSLPLTEKEKHILFGFIIKWFGGYPVNNLNEQVNVILKMIEKEFLKFPENSFEKEFCRTDHKIVKKLSEVAAHLGAVMPNTKIITPEDRFGEVKYDISYSRYINKISINFTELPLYIIEKGIIRFFEAKEFRSDDDYLISKDEFENFLSSIPTHFKNETVTKGIEYTTKVLKYHVDHECSNLKHCNLNESWERRIAIAESLSENRLTKSIISEKEKIITPTQSGFIIHGHNNEKKLEVARFIENSLGKKMTILHEQPNGGKTIIEKFQAYSDVDFAVAIWTADDLGKSIKENNYSKRARQNVVFETGFFIGKLGRKNVIVLFEDNIEIPSDYAGVLFIPLSNNWKDDLRKEIDEIYK
ncbi:MAG: nucleotide-binding protein [Rhizobacter sp.]|nr:nucleotide-binding protein [Ferruginibacter sp.]